VELINAVNSRAKIAVLKEFLQGQVGQEMDDSFSSCSHSAQRQ